MYDIVTHIAVGGTRRAPFWCLFSQPFVIVHLCALLLCEAELRRGRPFVSFFRLSALPQTAHGAVSCPERRRGAGLDGGHVQPPDVDA